MGRTLYPAKGVSWKVLMLSSPLTINDEARVLELRRYDLLDTEPEQAFDDIAELARLICRTPMSTVTLVDRDRQFFKAESGVGMRGSSRDDSLCTFAVEQTEPLIIEDTHQDPRSRNNPFVTTGPRLRFYAGAPLVTGNGFVLGTVCVFDTVPRKLEPEQIEALKALARQTMAQMELRLQLREGERRAEALRTAEKLAVVGRLASSMAHEINNPLQSMTNLLFMASLHAENPAKEFVEQAADELRRVTHIVTQTLRFHSQSVHAEPVRIGAIVESVVALFRTRLQHACVSIHIEDRQTAMLTCYSSDIRQVLANLVSNGLDAVVRQPQARIHFRVCDATHPRTGTKGVALTVSDNGSGMSSETLKRLFQPFFSTKGARGTGLGLWVSRGILDKHGAELRIRSCTDGSQRGTAFRIFFPHRGNSVPNGCDDAA